MDLPRVKVSTNDALTVTAHRFAMISRRRKKHRCMELGRPQDLSAGLAWYSYCKDSVGWFWYTNLCLLNTTTCRIRYGAFINIGLIGFLTTFLLLVDSCAWRIVRLPLEQFHFTRPFFISAVIVSCIGYVFVPLLDILHIHQIIRKEGPLRHYLKKRTPTMGGLFFVPVGVAVAQYIAGFSCIEVTGAAAVTLAYAAIGLLDDILSLSKNQNNGLSSWLRILLEVCIISFPQIAKCQFMWGCLGLIITKYWQNYLPFFSCGELCEWCHFSIVTGGSWGYVFTVVG